MKGFHPPCGLVCLCFQGGAVETEKNRKEWNQYVTGGGGVVLVPRIIMIVS